MADDNTEDVINEQDIANYKALEDATMKAEANANANANDYHKQLEELDKNEESSIITKLDNSIDNISKIATNLKDEMAHTKKNFILILENLKNINHGNSNVVNIINDAIKTKELIYKLLSYKSITLNTNFGTIRSHNQYMPEQDSNEQNAIEHIMETIRQNIIKFYEYESNDISHENDFELTTKPIKNMIEFLNKFISYLIEKLSNVQNKVLEDLHKKIIKVENNLASDKWVEETFNTDDNEHEHDEPFISQTSSNNNSKPLELPSSTPPPPPPQVNNGEGGKKKRQQRIKKLTKMLVDLKKFNKKFSHLKNNKKNKVSIHKKNNNKYLKKGGKSKKKVVEHKNKTNSKKNNKTNNKRKKNNKKQQKKSIKKR